MSHKITPTALIFSLSLFLSAGLLFAVQPLTGKMLLPLVGGSPSGWVVSMAFFQIALLIGYGASYGLGRLPVIAHGMVYLGLLGVGALFLPVGLAQGVDRSTLGTIIQSPTLSVIQMLGLGVGVPYIALATSGPTLQRLYAASGNQDSSDPYYLYAASNLGSFFGLLSYPFLVEPMLELPSQSLLWSIGYGGLGLFALTCLIIIARRGAAVIPVTHDADTKHIPITGLTRLQWLLCSAIPSSLILGVTTKITTDLGSAPLIWIIPLSLYLLTLVMAFAKRRRYNAVLIMLIMPAVIALVLHQDFYRISGYQLGAVILALLCFFIVCLCLHTRLADTRPAVKNLTEFYFFLSLGGAIGGALNAFVAPLLFSWYWEYPAMLLLALLVVPSPLQHRLKNNLRQRLTIAAAIIALSIMFYLFQTITESDQTIISTSLVKKILIAGSFFILLGLSAFPRALALGLLILCVGNDLTIADKLLERSRSFFGISLIFDETEENNKKRVVRFYTHGTTIHGLQIRTPTVSLEPLAYYTRNGPAGDFMTIDAPKKVALVGLGSGNLLCYQAPDRHFTVIEIDKKVIELANRWFTYTKDCNQPDFIVGDGRLEIASRKDFFDLIVIDAFSSDAIPLHLLTIEALQTYFDRLSPDGRLVMHITNRFFNLARPIAAISDKMGLTAAIKLWEPEDDDINENIGKTSHYIVLARTPALIEPFYARGWKKLEDKDNQRVWTDNYSNILPYLKILNINDMSEEIDPDTASKKQE